MTEIAPTKLKLYIYIYIYRERERERERGCQGWIINIKVLLLMESIKKRGKFTVWNEFQLAQLIKPPIVE